MAIKVKCIFVLDIVELYETNHKTLETIIMLSEWSFNEIIYLVHTVICLFSDIFTTSQ